MIVLCFYLVKPFPVYPSDDTLRDEGLMVDLFYQTENGNGFWFFCQQYNDLDRFAGISAYTVENGTAATQVMDDPLSYFIVFLRKDQELDGLTVSVQYGIYDIVAYEHFDKTEHDLFNIMEKKKWGTDEKEYTKLQCQPDGNIFV